MSERIDCLELPEVFAFLLSDSCYNLMVLFTHESLGLS